MEASREIYWNIGHGWTTLLPMYLLTLVPYSRTSVIKNKKSRKVV